MIRTALAPSCLPSALLLALTLFALPSTRLLAHDELRFVGTIDSIDTAKGRISVKYKENGRDEIVEVTLTAKTEVTRDKQPIARSELRPGVFVVVDALGCDDEYEAVAVRIVPPPAG
jgi:hypothetical protein